MDVIGDVLDVISENSPKSEEVPGKASYDLSIRRPLTVLATGLFVGVVGLLGSAYWNLGYIGGAIALTTLAGLVAVSAVATGYTIQWHALYSDYRLVRRFAVKVLEQSDSQAGFIAAFRPPPGEVERILMAAAYVVLTTHKDLAHFQRKGLGSQQRDIAAAEPEEELELLELATMETKEKLSREIANALARFRQLRDLAEAQGYQVHESWKDYISTDILPKQLKRGACQ
jgi:hypothetical protein